MRRVVRVILAVVTCACALVLLFGLAGWIGVRWVEVSVSLPEERRPVQQSVRRETVGVVFHREGVMRMRTVEHTPSEDVPPTAGGWKWEVSRPASEDVSFWIEQPVEPPWSSVLSNRRWMGFARGWLDNPLASLGSAEGRPVSQRVEWVVVPWWAIVAASAPVPVWRAIAWRRRRRARRRVEGRRCTGCGYDVRATPEADGAVLARCPECGADVGQAGDRT